MALRSSTSLQSGPAGGRSRPACRLGQPSQRAAWMPLSSPAPHAQVPSPTQQQAEMSTARRRSCVCQATDPDKQANSWSVIPSRFNPAYAAIVGGYAGLFALQNPYIFAALSIATIIPQNSTTTSLNSLVILFYDSGLFMNFAEAVYCVRLVTWLSILCCLLSFAIFS